jgi:Ca2+-transporting ATPase
MAANHFQIKGLTADQIESARVKYGSNELSFEKENGLLDALKSIAKEPMVLLLLVAAAIYFISGDMGDAIFLSGAIVLVATISLFQDARSRNALEKLKKFTKPFCKVIRDDAVIEIKTEELVVGDSLMVEEGSAIAADGIIVHSNDFSVNESILTGESMVVFKDAEKDDHSIFQGTIVTSGLAIVTVTAIGNNTKLGKIGSSLQSIKEEKTPLELQINQFVKKMVMIGGVVFLIVWLMNYLHTFSILDSLLKALTLAMSILPEEIPVAFTTFMALGAWRLMKMGIVVKQMKTVETLGSATVICTDKTGTLTENQMSLAEMFVVSTNQFSNPNGLDNEAEKELISLAMWASEPIPFDPMELAIHQLYAEKIVPDQRPNYTIIHEYPLDGKPPMMTHLFENKKGDRIIAAKGAPEALLEVSTVSAAEKEMINKAVAILAAKGYRTLGVGVSTFTGNYFPVKQQQFSFVFKGVLAFYDPPKKNIPEVMTNFYKAGISVKIITGDNAATTLNIAQQVGLRGADKSISGDELMDLEEMPLRKKVMDIQVFTRMFSDAKLKIINALKANQQIVAMTGDGVNDGPALKAAHIGIAMGKKGSEIAKQAASLILLEDDLARMFDAVAMGRRIYTNLKKAIQYIISIHIPIVLTVFIPLALGWIYPNIFSPVHIIFFELIMGPTCSIIYENEPIEKNTMTQPPRLASDNFFNWKELTTSIIQGLCITAGILFIYQYATHQQYDEAITRSMVFTTLIAANVFLTLVNRSFYYSILTTLAYKNNLVILIISITILITALLLFVAPLRNFFHFAPLTLLQLILTIFIGFISVIWYEVVKWRKRNN